jgi:hypothetical protein
VWQLAYRDASGAEVADAVVLVDEVVVRVAPGLVPNTADDLTGARVESALARFGPADEVVMGVGGATVRFGERTFLVTDGRIVGSR